jgi:hypothetical protein
MTRAGDRVDFSKGRSDRIRAGLAWSHETSARTAFRLGAAAEYEATGDSRAEVYGVEIPSPTLKGWTAHAEAGFDFKPRIGSPFTISLTARGFAGVRRGGSGMLSVTYSF